VRELRGPFPEIPIVPTGGVTAETAPEFIRAGAAAVGLGSWLIGDRDPSGIAERATRVTGAVATARASG
jgi:2-dehydro-3-deoxyphosphogluconate aldolase/(4S)-4-hydroxy-2-oxoglutarate aldolase